MSCSVSPLLQLQNWSSVHQFRNNKRLPQHNICNITSSFTTTVIAKSMSKYVLEKELHMQRVDGSPFVFFPSYASIFHIYISSSDQFIHDNCFHFYFRRSEHHLKIFRVIERWWRRIDFQFSHEKRALVAKTSKDLIGLQSSPLRHLSITKTSFPSSYSPLIPLLWDPKQMFIVWQPILIRLRW